MKRFYETILLLAVSVAACQAQTDTTALLKEASDKLKTGNAMVSDILTAPYYLSIHPQTSFRDLIKQYAKAGVLSIATASEPGKKINVLVNIRNNSGQPIEGALVYLYQTDSRGWYAADAPHVLLNEGDMRHARLFGYVKTDKQGQVELHTVKPSGYPNSELPAHIHIYIEAKGYRSYISELLFDDDDRLKGEVRNRAMRERFIIAKPGMAKPPFEQQFSYEIPLQKSN